jgi:hypothetical protein
MGMIGTRSRASGVARLKSIRIGVWAWRHGARGLKPQPKPEIFIDRSADAILALSRQPHVKKGVFRKDFQVAE